MKEYKIWKFIPGKYLQTVTVSLEEEYPCKQKRCGYSCLGDKTEHVQGKQYFWYIKIKYRIRLDDK